ncbi:hypothetical protein BO70DRAFT_382215 [Aspergillus heteromorphus CBS 117.55]|uniref:N-acetyltransferase domain-containing protein n=1 Tax=Aspergillus heteromorphus CBS 117.55 TaxID=1448321 RepID=A0A317V9Y9_9EURO|nr:uncharacterized protein BO70DRAFT_382215 [Aspergillus heteromorphus CBS 117.55]PWY71036.1 hypothetical protein BO70DRAFT_382215 [Aspergillus heteromorphus CBS 117.55]
MTLKPGFTIAPVPATREAGKTLAKIESSAIDNGADASFAKLLWPKQSTDTKDEKKNDEEEKDEDPFHTIDMLSDPANKYAWIIESATENPVAYVWWQHAKGKTEEEWAATYANRYRPDSMNKALMDATSGVRFLKRAKLLNTRETLILKELYVRPEFQRQGLGGALVQWGIDEADRLGLQAYTEASPDGYGLYVRFGLEEVDRVTVDLEPWGGNPGEYNSYALLLRPARVEAERN